MVIRSDLSVSLFMRIMRMPRIAVMSQRQGNSQRGVGTACHSKAGSHNQGCHWRKRLESCIEKERGAERNKVKDNGEERKRTAKRRKNDMPQYGTQSREGREPGSRAETGREKVEES